MIMTSVREIDVVDRRVIRKQYALKNVSETMDTTVRDREKWVIVRTRQEGTPEKTTKRESSKDKSAGQEAQSWTQIIVLLWLWGERLTRLSTRLSAESADSRLMFSETSPNLCRKPEGGTKGDNKTRQGLMAS